MSFQRGALRKVHHKAGDRWMLRYRMTRADGKRLECREFVGLVLDFPTEKAARREIERLGLHARINAQEADTRIRFHALALHYLEHDCGPDALRPKTERTVLNTSHIVHAYLIPQWGEVIADDINRSIYSIGSKPFTPRRAWHGRRSVNFAARCFGFTGSGPCISSWSITRCCRSRLAPIRITRLSS